MSSRRSLTSQSISSLAWESVSRFGQQGLTLLSTAILAHLLTPTSYGVMGMAALLINFASTLNDLGIPAAIVQRPQLDQRTLSSLFWVNLLFSLSVTTIIFVLSPLAAEFFHEPTVTSILQVLSFSFLISGCASAQHALFYREMNLRPPAVAQIISSTAGLITAVVMALKGMGVWSLVASALVNRLVDTILMWFMHPWRPSCVLYWNECRPIIKTGLNLSGFGIVNYFSRNADNLIVGRILGSAPLGYYQNSYSLMYYPQQTLNSTISNVMLAALSKLQDDPPRFRQALLRLATLSAFALLPAMLGMAVTADLLIRVVLGSQWEPAGPVLAILALAGFLQSISAPTGQIYVPTGNTALLFRWSLATSSLTVLGFLVGVKWGIIGVATSFAVVQLLLVYPLLWMALHLIELPVSQYLRSLQPPFWLSIAMAAVVVLWRWLMSWAGLTYPLSLLVTSILVGALTYFGLIWVIRPTAALDILDVIGNSDIAIIRRPANWLKGSWS